MSRLAAAAPILMQSALDAGYDTYAFGRKGDIKQGLAAGIGGVPLGLLGAAGAHKALPAKYRLAGAMLGNFAGSVLGAEIGMRGLQRFRTATNYQPIVDQPLESLELQASPVLSSMKSAR
jgi:uncharacterized membrane protein YfcA